MLLQDLEGDLRRSHEVNPRAGSWDSFLFLDKLLPDRARPGSPRLGVF